MVAQTSYELNIGKGYNGQLYSANDYNYTKISRIAEGLIEFGRATSRGTDLENQVEQGGNDYQGIAFRSLDREGEIFTGKIQYNDKDTVGLLVVGYIWLVCPAGCTAGDPVKYDPDTGILDAGVALAGEIQLDNAAWESTASAGDIAYVYVPDRLVTLIT